jgi:alanine-alpha-ketoisovalerate/valine-pyruvate aminotransferase
MNESDRDMLKNEAIVAKHYNTLRAELVDFFKKATAEIRKGTRKNVLVRVSSDYMPVIDKVVKEDAFANFYNITVRPPRKTFPGVKFKYKVLVELKED